MLTREQIRDRVRVHQVTLTASTSDLSDDAAANQKDCDVDDGTIFSAGMTVKIKDDEEEEFNEVASVDGNTVTMVNNLTNTYTTGENGVVCVCTDIFDSVVPERKIRHIVYIGIMGDGTSRTAEILKDEETAGSQTMKFDNIPVPPADTESVPEDWHFDIENPFLNLEGGTNLTAIASAGAPELTIIYWDTPEI